MANLRPYFKTKCSQFQATWSTAMMSWFDFLFTGQRKQPGAIVNSLGVYTKHINYFHVHCQEGRKIVHFHLGVTVSRGYEMQTHGRKDHSLLQNRLWSHVLKAPAYCYISYEVLNIDFTQTNGSRYCYRLLSFSSACELRDLHNDLYKSSCAF